MLGRLARPFVRCTLAGLTARHATMSAPLPTTVPVLVLPGLGGSEAEHWQSLWQDEAGFARVQQDSWTAPNLDDWMAQLTEAVAAAPSPPLLLCHSLGGVLAAHYLASGADAKASVAGAFLVAPPDLDRLDTRSLDDETVGCLETFRPLPRQPLGVPSVVVTSTTDAYLTTQQAAQLAEEWGATLCTAEAGGHINAASGCGPWPEGRRLLADLVARIGAL